MRSAFAIKRICVCRDVGAKAYGTVIGLSQPGRINASEPCTD